MMGTTANPSATPMTTELRCSNATPVQRNTASFNVPGGAPVSAGTQSQKIMRSMLGPSVHAITNARNVATVTTHRSRPRAHSANRLCAIRPTSSAAATTINGATSSEST